LVRRLEKRVVPDAGKKLEAYLDPFCESILIYFSI
jgi:hypothetical protein